MNVYKCGGSLIHPSVVMTVAHCVVDLNVHDLLIRAGEWDTQTRNEPYPHQDRAATEIIIHEKYTPGSHFNDIALLILEKPVDLAENVNTACLPPHEVHFDHQRCFATGWGWLIIFLMSFKFNLYIFFFFIRIGFSIYSDFVVVDFFFARAN